MRPLLRFRLTAGTLRVELDGALLHEEPTAIAYRYDARLEEGVLLAVGREALETSERLRTFDWSAVPDPRDRRTCIVPVEEAAWFARLASGTTPAEGDPWEHHGEIVIVRPFALGGPVRAQLAYLYLARNLVLDSGKSPLGWLRRTWLRLAAPVDVVLPALPSEDREHATLVQGLRGIFGIDTLLDGAPARPRQEAPLGKDDWTRLAVLAGVWASVAGLYTYRVRHPSLGGLAVLLALAGAFSLMARRTLSLRAPAAGEPTAPRASPRLLDAGPDADPHDFQGAAAYQLGTTGRFSIGAALVFPAILGLHYVPARWLHLWSVNAPLPMFASVAGALLVTLFLMAGRVSLGERGITLRQDGLLGRALRIPYARIRHVATRTTLQGHPRVIFLFRDGQEIAVGYELHTQARAARLRELETAITPRLAPPASYRAASTRVAT